MKPDERALRSLVQQWISKAEVDLRTAERLMRDADRIRESIAFHSQQAGEKYLVAGIPTGIDDPGGAICVHGVGLWGCSSPVFEEISRIIALSFGGIPKRISK
jgi:HEPN domain